MEYIVIDAIKKRSSIRAYMREKFTTAKLNCLKKAAFASPMAKSRQHLRFIFITNKVVISEIENITVGAIYAEGAAEAAERLRPKNGKLIYEAPLFYRHI